MHQILIAFMMLFALTSVGYAQISDPAQSEVVGPDAVPIAVEVIDSAVALPERPFTVTGENTQLIKPSDGRPYPRLSASGVLGGGSIGIIRS
jgi:hypothetical protein